MNIVRLGWLVLLISFGAHAVDTDGDGVDDFVDNCITVPNGPLLPDAGGHSQRDTDGDGYGNVCDPDFNQDLEVTAFDYLILRGQLNTNDPLTDLNGDGVVSAFDYLILRNQLNQSPGPSSIAQEQIASVTKAELQATGGHWTVPGVGSFLVPWGQMADGDSVEIFTGGPPALPGEDFSPAGSPVKLLLPPGLERFRLTLEAGDYLSRYTGRGGFPFDMWSSGETVYLNDTIIATVREWLFTPLFGGRCDYPVEGGEVTWIRTATESCATEPAEIEILRQAIAETQVAFGHCNQPFYKIMVLPSGLHDAQSNMRWAFFNRSWLQSRGEAEQKSSTYHELHHILQGAYVGRDAERTWLLESSAVQAESIVDGANTSWVDRYVWDANLPARGLGTVLRESIYTGVSYLHFVRAAMGTYDLCDFYESQSSHIRSGRTQEALSGYVGVGPSHLHRMWQHDFRVYRSRPYADLLPQFDIANVDLENLTAVQIGDVVQWHNPEQTQVCLHVYPGEDLPADASVTMTRGDASIRTNIDSTDDTTSPLYGQSARWWELDVGTYAFAVATAEGVSLLDAQPSVVLQVTREACP